jgi:hypothetical protein
MFHSIKNLWGAHQENMGQFWIPAAASSVLEKNARDF